MAPDWSAATTRALEPLLGLPIATTYAFGAGRGFTFGTPTTHDDGRVGAPWVLHLDGAWRLEGPDGLVTGVFDHWEPHDDAHPDGATRQHVLLGRWLSAELLPTGGLLAGAPRELRSLETDRFGGARLSFDDGHALVLWPAGSAVETWRIWHHPTPDGPHVVLADGRVHGEPDDAWRRRS